MKTLLSLTLALAALTPVPAVAQDAPFAERIVVRTADLNLGADAGRRTLDHRIALAIVEACGTASNVDVAGKNDVRRCREETRASVAAERERLTALASRGSDIVIAAR